MSKKTKPDETPATKPRFEPRQIKHTLTPEERNDVADCLCKSLAAIDRAEEDFESVKAQHKSTVAAHQAEAGKHRQLYQDGFRMQMEQCQVVLRPTDKKKDFWFPSFADGGTLVATEDMTDRDFQLELIEAEEAFEERKEIQLFPPTPADRGIIIVGRMAGKWQAAARIVIGGKELADRLNSEQKMFKERFAAIEQCAKGAMAWIEESHGKEVAQGFVEPFGKAVDTEKEKVE